MKHQFSTLVLSLLAICFFATTTSAQISTSALNSSVIHPFGTAFSPFGKFTGVGESGGVPGPTANGCDLYGFRAQLEPSLAVSLGMGNTPIDDLPLSPILSFESADFPFFIQQQNAFGNGTGDNFGCGKVLATYYDDPNSNFVYQIFGSALANGGIWQVSDERLKRDVEPIEGALDKVMQMNGVSYQYRTDEFAELNLDQGLNYGFLTQEVKATLPGAVRSGRGLDGKEADFDVMQYAMVIPVLTEAMKEQQEVIQDNDATIQELEDRLLRLEALLLKSQDANGNSSTD